jgi:hypothetical protein
MLAFLVHVIQRRRSTCDSNNSTAKRISASRSNPFALQANSLQRVSPLNLVAQTLSLRFHKLRTERAGRIGTPLTRVSAPPTSGDLSSACSHLAGDFNNFQLTKRSFRQCSKDLVFRADMIAIQSPQSAGTVTIGGDRIGSGTLGTL